jgi:predicted transposase/invertase (TIGR01784 family)
MESNSQRVITLADIYRQEGVKTVAKNLLKEGFPLEKIAQATNLSKRELKKLRNT